MDAGAAAAPGQPCPGCGIVLPSVDGPTHRYMLSSPECWAVYGEVLAREYSNLAYWRSHRVTVDCYAAQHPGEPSPQSINSVCLHLMRLCATVEQELEADAAVGLMKRIAANKRDLVWLDPPPDLGAASILDVAGAATAAEHEQAVMAWARSLWTAWSPHHAQVRSWLEAFSAG